MARIREQNNKILEKKQATKRIYMISVRQAMGAYVVEGLKRGQWEQGIRQRELSSATRLYRAQRVTVGDFGPAQWRVM